MQKNVTIALHLDHLYSGLNLSCSLINNINTRYIITSVLYYCIKPLQFDRLVKR